jgi:UDP-N-acetylglucosamine/UDP-N-acetylgalactosamine diphosphorylase
MADLHARLLDMLKPLGQERVLRFWDRLNDVQRMRLARQIESFDLELVDELVKTRVLASGWTPALEFGPIEVQPLARTGADRKAVEHARLVGELLLSQGRAAAVVVAGGQGTRLGYDGPKGTFPIGVLSGKSLFQLQVERLRALAARHGTRIPLFVMTSDTNDASTREFLARGANFGMAPTDVFVFCQGMMPAVDFEGKLILDECDHVFANPNGHGGVWPGLAQSGALDAMKRRGITDIFHYQVDNPLVDVADPVFLGFHHEAQAQMSSKVARKRDASEPVGVTVRRSDGRAAVVEYTLLSQSQAERREPDGSLTFAAGNLCIYWYTLEFAERVGRQARLPWNVARKKVPFVDERGRTVECDQPNGVKFETFVFDAMPAAERVFVMECDRADEFAPVKNASGEDSVDTCRAAMVEKAARMLEAAGVRVPRHLSHSPGAGAPGRSKFPVEISPLFALDAEELRRKLPSGFAVTGPVLLPPSPSGGGQGEGEPPDDGIA